MISGSYVVMENQVVNSSDVCGQTISGARLVQVAFQNCTFSDCVFYATSFETCKFIGCHFKNCSFVFTHIKNCTFQSSKFEKCELVQGGLYGNHFSICQYDATSSDFMDFNHNELEQCFTDEQTAQRINLIYKLAAA